MDALIAFLRARLDEEDELAHSCGAVAWVDDVPGSVQVDPKAIRDAKWAYGHLGYVVGADPSPLGDAYRAHISLHDPAFVLADIEAKRQIIDHYYELVEQSQHNDLFGYHATGVGVALHHLALPYASHPDYRAEWIP